MNGLLLLHSSSGVELIDMVTTGILARFKSEKEKSSKVRFGGEHSQMKYSVVVDLR